ncbi:hypothetical protein [Streptomyces antibioticus]|uniref:hypothetical protein n=1 Tax=Streptomyces antibioticus TaxID=1890 RepID=UPI0033A979A4
MQNAMVSTEIASQGTTRPPVVTVPEPSGRPHPLIDGVAAQVAARADELALARTRAAEAIERARAGLGAGHQYLADFLADGLENGVDPRSIETAARRLAAACSDSTDTATLLRAAAGPRPEIVALATVSAPAALGLPDDELLHAEVEEGEDRVSVGVQGDGGLLTPQEATGLGTEVVKWGYKLQVMAWKATSRAFTARAGDLAFRDALDAIETAVSLADDPEAARRGLQSFVARVAAK